MVRPDRSGGWKWRVGAPRRRAAGGRLVLAALLALGQALTMPAARAQQLPSAAAETPPPADQSAIRADLLAALVRNQLEANERRIERLSAERAGLILAAETILTVTASDPSPPLDPERIEQLDRQLDLLQQQQLVLRTELEDIAGPPAAEPALVAPAALARDDAERLQEALVYLGHYDGRIDGKLGRRTQAAIAQFQAELGDPATGDLTEPQRSRLLAAATARQRAYGMQLLRGAEAGYSVIYPDILLPLEEQAGPTYRRFTNPAKDSSLQVVEDTPGDLEMLFADLLGRYAVDYSRLRSDWFVVSGTVRDRLFYDMARLVDGRIIHLRLSFPVAQRGLWDPLTVILYNSFQPDPEAG